MKSATVPTAYRGRSCFFLLLAAAISIVPENREFKLAEANEALILLKEGKVRGAGVLKITE